MTRHAEQLAELGDCAGGDDVEFSLEPLDFALGDRHLLQAEVRHDATEEVRPELARLVQCHWATAEHGDDESWEAWAGPDVAPTPCAARKAEELRAVHDMT